MHRPHLTVIVLSLLLVPLASLHAWDHQVDTIDMGYVKDVTLAPAGDLTPWRILALDRVGIAVLDAKGDEVSAVTGHLIERVDAQSVGDQVMVVAPEENAGVHLWSMDAVTGQLSPWMGKDSLWPVDFAPVVACLTYDLFEQQAFVFAATEQGTIHHYRIVDDPEDPSIRRIRTLEVGGEITSCAPGAEGEWLYVAEPGVGIWRLGLDSEAERIREPVALVAPFGFLDEAIKVSVASDGALSILGEDNIYFVDPDGAVMLSSQPVPAEMSGAEGFDNDRDWMVFAVEGDEREGGGRLFSTAMPALELERVVPPPRVATVQPTVESEPVNSAGDAADDPAVWLHPEDSAKSLVLGTDKKSGLYVYDLAGEVQQFLPAGKVNNVDVRYGFELNDGDVVDIAVATNRSNGRLSIWGIDRSSGELEELGVGDENLVMNEPYGLCLYHNAEDNTFYALANSKAGEVEQHRLIAADQARITTELVRSFEVGSITEGCVVDDAHHRLFIGEETRGIWAYDARPKASASRDDRSLVDAVRPEGRLTADIEGLALYLDGAEAGYLVASVQGANQFAVYDRQPPYAFHGFFQIVADPEMGIDGVSETDGLEVVSQDLGSDFAKGMLVVQDGRNVEPVENQNYKFVPWASVAQLVFDGDEKNVTKEKAKGF